MKYIINKIYISKSIKMPETKKRTFGEAFGQHAYEIERYNGEISDDYFTKGGVGHGIYIEPTNRDTQKDFDKGTLLSLNKRELK